MKKLRTKLGSSLFDLASKVYPKGKKGRSARKELGDLLFKVAAKISPNKTKKTKK